MQTTSSSVAARQLVQQQLHPQAAACSRLCQPRSQLPVSGPRCLTQMFCVYSACAPPSCGPCAAACSRQPVSQLASSPVGIPWHSVKRAIQVLHHHHLVHWCRARRVTPSIGLQAGHCTIRHEGSRMLECTSDGTGLGRTGWAHHPAADSARWSCPQTPQTDSSDGSVHLTVSGSQQQRRSHTLPGREQTRQQNSLQGARGP